MGPLQHHPRIVVVLWAWARRLGAGILAVCLLAAVFSPAAVARSRSCTVRGSRTIQRLDGVRIYAQDKQVYACSTRYGRHVFVYKRAFAHGFRTLLIAAQVNQTVLAAGFAQPPYPPGSDAVLVSRNLKTGALLRRYTDTSCAGGSCDLTITRLVTNTNGSFAWIDDLEGPGSVAEDAVIEDDSAGLTVLDDELSGAYCFGMEPPAGPCAEDIDTSYLKAANGTVYWEGGPSGSVQSASFN